MERFSQPESHKEHLIDQARMLREEAKATPGTVRNATIRAARQTDVEAYLNEWAGSKGLRSPM